MHVLRRAAAFAALFLWTSALAALAQDVTLTSRDGLITLHGTMASYDGELYRVKTAYGLLTLDGQGVTCVGPGCPDLTDYIARARLVAPLGTEALVSALIGGFAADSGFVVEGDIGAGLTLRGAVSGQAVAQISVTMAADDQGMADLQTGKADLVLSMQYLARLPGRVQVLALDAGVAVVSASSPLRHLSLPQLGQLLSGQVRNWKALGGPDAPVVLHVSEPGVALLRAVARQLGAVTATGMIRHAAPADLARAVADDPWAVAITSVSAEGAARVLDLSGDCGFLLHADPVAIKSGDYPLSAPIYLYTSDRRLPLVLRDLVEWTAGAAAQPAVRSVGLIDQSPARTGIARQGERLAHAVAAAGPDVGLEALQGMVQAMAATERLSVTFRFDGGARELDAQSLGQVQALAQALEAGIYDGQVLTFAGFSDGRGDVAGNLAVSRKRAEAVRDAVVVAAPLLDKARVTLEAEGYGEALPLACDDTDSGAGVNRRVEVWVRPAPGATDSPPSGN